MDKSQINISSIENQAEHCRNNSGPVTGLICAALAGAVCDASATGRRVLAWAGEPIADAMPLRLVAGIHALHLAGEIPEMDRVYDGVQSDPAVVAGLLSEILVKFDHRLMPWLDNPPQTNEGMRSVTLMAGLSWLAMRGADKFELLEIGSSAGFNLLMDRYHYDLDGHLIGPPSSPVTLRPQWKGNPPPTGKPHILSARGVDLRPVDVRDAQQAEKLRAYIWHDHKDRFARFEAAVEMIRDKPVEIDRGDAADWVEQQLASPLRPGIARVLMHSIVWQYLSEDGKARITAAMEQAGKDASEGSPLVWLSLETNCETFQHELKLRCWAGKSELATGKAVHLANAHAHGAWVEWLV